MSRPLDLICLGRAAVDFYGEQIGGRLEDMQSFKKYLGGSSANLCAGVARLGLRSSMLTRVGHEHMGRFVRESLAGFGADVSHVKTDPDRLTASVVLGIEGEGAYPHIFFRENCADMGVCVDDFDERYIASSGAFAVTGTHLSTERTRAAVEQAFRWAKKNGTKCVLDIDYRPVLWRLTAAGDGASRFVASDTVTASLQPLIPLCDLVVGTEEEIRIAGGSDDVLTAIRRIRALTTAVIVIKRGATGCAIVPGAVPDDLGQALVVAGFPVEVLNVLGAGDAFLSGFLSGWLRGEALDQCGRLGNACGALVVSRHACSPAMPSQAELQDFMNRPTPVRRPDLDPVIQHMHHATTVRRHPKGDLFVLAFDHRRQLEELVDELGKPRAAIATFTLEAEVLNDGGRIVTESTDLQEAHRGGGGSRRRGLRHRWQPGRDRRCATRHAGAREIDAFGHLDRTAHRTTGIAAVEIRRHAQRGPAHPRLARWPRHQVPGLLSPR
jgi:5-dehydro-2-deoxygluconokinase